MLFFTLSKTKNKNQRRRRRLFRRDGRLRRRPPPRGAVRGRRAGKDAEHGDACRQRDREDDRDRAPVGPGEGREARGKFFCFFCFNFSPEGGVEVEKQARGNRTLTPFFFSLSLSLPPSLLTGGHGTDGDGRRGRRRPDEEGAAAAAAAQQSWSALTKRNPFCSVSSFQVFRHVFTLHPLFRSRAASSSECFF